MFETQKSGNKTSSGEIGLDIRTHASPKVGHDQVSSVGMPHPLQMFYGSAQEFYAAFELTRRLTKLDVICIFLLYAFHI